MSPGRASATGTSVPHLWWPGYRAPAARSAATARSSHSPLPTRLPRFATANCMTARPTGEGPGVGPAGGAGEVAVAAFVAGGEDAVDCCPWCRGWRAKLRRATGAPRSSSGRTSPWRSLRKPRLPTVCCSPSSSTDCAPTRSITGGASFCASYARRPGPLRVIPLAIAMRYRLERVALHPSVSI